MKRDPKTDGPHLSIIIPVLAINDYIRNENVPALEVQTYRSFEVILLPNEMTLTDEKLLDQYEWLKIIPTHEITRPALKRNIGAQHARGEILAFIDDDAYPSSSWLTSAVKVFNEDPDIDVLCGPGVLPPDSPFLEKVFDEVLKTWVGSGGLAYRFIQKEQRFVDDYPTMNFLVKKEIFDRVGGFNDDYWPGEDSKLCEDIVYKLHKKILYDPRVLVYHHRRNDLVKYLRQHGQYGYHRGSFFAQGDANSRKLVYLIPTLFTLYLAALFFIFYLFPFTFYLSLIPLVGYLSLLATLFTSAFTNTRSLQISFSSTVVLFLMHLTYGVQFIHGFVGTMINSLETHMSSKR